MNVRRIQPIKKAGGRLISEPASGLMMFQLQLFVPVKNFRFAKDKPNISGINCVTSGPD